MNNRYKKYDTVIIAILIIFLVVFAYIYLFKKDIVSITLNKHYLKLYVRGQEKLEVTINPTDLSNEKLKWTSENPGIANVNEEGVISANTIGTTKIIVSDKNDKATDICVVEVKKKILDSIELDKKEINLQIGEENVLKPIITPKDLQNEKIKWSSTNSSVATVDENGKVHGISYGIALVTGELLGQEASSLIVVGGVRTNSLKIKDEELSIEIGNSRTLEVEINPLSAIKENIIWESSNENVLSVDQTGKITAKSLGSATITAKTEYSEVKDIVTIKVEKVKYEVTYMELNKKDLIEDGDTLGTLPIITKEYHKLLGWYTKETGGEKVSEDTIVTENMTLYPHWESTMYVLPEKFVIPKGYSLISSQSYSSNTLKYKTIKKDNDNFYSLIWVKDAYKQLNSANNNFKGGERTVLLNNEIGTMHYQNKGLISTNGSFTISYKSNTPIIMSKGQMYENKNYAIAKAYTILTIGRDNKLKANRLMNVKQTSEWLTSVGARNTWAVTTVETSHWNGGNDGGKDRRTAVCQVDDNNFVLYTGLATGIHDYMKELHNLFGCKTVVNLDGGGSTGMFYKTNTMNSIGTIYIYRRSGECCRHIADMLYFVEQ